MFDVAKRLLVIESDDSVERARFEETLNDTHPVRRVAQMSALRIDVLICGALSRPLEAMLVSAGVRVVAQTSGPVDEVVEAFKAGLLNEQAFLTPGCRRGGQRGRGRGRGRFGERLGGRSSW